MYLKRLAWERQEPWSAPMTRYLNMVGGIVALHMVDYGKVPTTLGMQKILEGLDVYTETCENLMRE